MSERQRFVTKITTKLSLPILTEYSLFLLLNERDSSTIFMLQNSIRQIINNTGNQSLKAIFDKMNYPKFGSDIKKLGFGKGRINNKEDSTEKSQKDEEKQNKKDIRNYATDLFQKLYFKDALILFNQIIKEDKAKGLADIKIQRMRAESYLVLFSYQDAFKIAKKYDFIDILFVSAISLNNFEFSFGLLDEIIKYLNIQKVHNRESVVSNYELVCLGIFILLSVSNSITIKNISKKLFEASNYDIPILKEITRLFIKRDYLNFLSHFNDITMLVESSLYLNHLKDEVMKKISSNIVINYAMPFSRVSFNQFQNDLSLNQDTIIDALKDGIRANKLNGKIDFIDNYYYGGIGEQRYHQSHDVFVKALLIEKQFKLNEFFMGKNP